MITFKHIQNQKGSAIAWSMLIGMLLLIFTASLLTISLSYSKRSQISSLKKQTFYTARCALDMIAEEFLHSSENAEKIYSYLQDGTICPDHTWEISEVHFKEEHPEMGSCSLSVILQKKTYITIYTHAVRAEEECVLALTLVGVLREASSESTSSEEEELDFFDLSWEIKSYSESVPDFETSSTE